MTEWHNVGDDYKYQFAETSDPRLVAVIERDEEYGGGHIDGDVYAPAFYWDRYWGKIDGPAGSTFTDDTSREILERIVEARSRFYDRRMKWEVVERYAWIFHRTTLEQVSSSIDQNCQVAILNTPTWREHVGITDEQINRFEVNSVTGPGQGIVQEIVDASAEDEARALHLTNHSDEGRRITFIRRASVLDGDVADWTAALDGDVYGIGWAVNEARRLPDDEPIDLLDGDWEISIECWGFLGEDYAKQSAFAFEAGSPTLPEMLEVPA